MSDLVDRARRFAVDAHRNVGQLRKYTGQPYDEHLRAVAEMVGLVTNDDEVIAAAWLHDVVEDTPATVEEIERPFGPRVGALVAALTDVSRPHHGNRAARKALDREHLARAPADAQTVKLADLIDNCQDICKHNARFGRVYLEEMGALLEILTEGDESLQRRARKAAKKWSVRLSKQDVGSTDEAASPLASLRPSAVQRALHIFARGICVRDIAETLPRFDADASASFVPLPVACPVVGILTDGRVTAYALRSELGIKSRGEAMRPITEAQLLEAEAGLADVVKVLTRHDYCFVSVGGEVEAYVGREEMQGPVARMWLFGLITTLELALTEQIRAAGDESRWMTLLTPLRLEKARALQRARAELGRQVPLVDCLQLADKIRIMPGIDGGPRPLLRGQSKAESQRLARDLEDLRNNLAHAQDIVTNDWSQIVRLAKRLEELAMEGRHGPSAVGP